MAEFEKMNLESLDVVDERLAQMRELFPEVFSESGIDFDKLSLWFYRGYRQLPARGARSKP